MKSGKTEVIQEIESEDMELNTRESGKVALTQCVFLCTGQGCQHSKTFQKRVAFVAIHID